jgi:HTH-type transcriptional regulator / antitoxin HigA
MAQKSNKNLELAREMLSPPGDTLLETIETLGMNQNELAERMGRPIKTINEIIKGKEAITPNTAIQLELVLKIKAAFWLERERQYRQALAELDQQERQQDWANSWLVNFPVKIMVKLGWMPRLQSDTEIVNALLSYFGVATPDDWKSVYVGSEMQKSYYRLSLAHVTSPESLTVWLRKGELQVKELTLPEYDKKKFQENLQTIRALVRLHPTDFKEQLQNLCKEAGVALVFTPALPKTNVSGVSRWVGNNVPLIQLSDRYKSNDQFWFSFFHEAGHLLHHGKKDFCIEGELEIEMDTEKEKEANDFSANLLIPRKEYQNFITKEDFSESAIRDFAEMIEMHPAIVAGRLGFDGNIHVSLVNRYRVRVEMKENV